MEFASEMIMEASAKGKEIAEVPITYHPRESEATLDSFRDGWRHVKFMLQNAPGYLFSLPGALLVALGTMIMTAAFLSVQITTATETIRIGLRSMVARSLLTIAGYQVVSIGVFSTIASDPIRCPTDRITSWLVENLTLARGGVAGVLVFAIGGTYAGYILFRWLTAGYQSLPVLTHDILAFTLIVLGVQTVFTSFFMSVLSDSR